MNNETKEKRVENHCRAIKEMMDMPTLVKEIFKTVKRNEEEFSHTITHCSNGDIQLTVIVRLTGLGIVYTYKDKKLISAKSNIQEISGDK